ncbi:MAG TPA: amino acid--tRNA ligase-related protein [Candidatus Sulfotelmatobacter sp.]|jgi:asparaginyl-tRNA synthetase|nr:amino acid--tRNA ligase-related protein [Candidatus Sulfotelmatobacter sp.]
MKAIKLSIEGKKRTIDFKNHFAHLVSINQSLIQGAAKEYESRGMTYCEVPEIVGITGACENVDTLFKVGNRLDIPLFFTQTGQLALEQALQSFPGCWTVIHSGRDEEEEDTRHLRQFRLTEEEFDCTMVGMTRVTYNEDSMYEALLTAIQRTAQAMVKKVLKDNENTLKTIYQRDTKKLHYMATHNFLRVTYEEAVKLLNKNGFPKVAFGDDLQANHEAKIVELLNKKETELPVFIMKYPKKIKFFNMKVSKKDDRVCLSADLIFPYAGEGTGASVREHDFAKLTERLLTSTMYKLHVERGGTLKDFTWYLDIMKEQKTNPHAGYGMGNDRVLQYIFGSNDIRTTSIFALLNAQTGDWDKKRYGKGAILTAEKKHVLLSIGQLANKKKLLPTIKAANKNKAIIFYATEKTHAFLATNGIATSLIHKISDKSKTPNISNLLQQKLFDVIITIPTHKKTEGTELTDGKKIRKAAIEQGMIPITSVEIAILVLENLSK